MDNNTAKETWQEVLPLLEKEVSILSYDVWIKTLEPMDIVDGKLILIAASATGKEFVSSRLLGLIKRAVQMVNQLISDVDIIAKEELKDFPSGETFVIEEEPKKMEFLAIRPQYNFENFVVGKSNKLAYAAAHAVAEEPGTRYNPLFIYGGAGLGKTHLMHSIGNHIRLVKPGLKILFATSDKFINDLVQHIGLSKNGNSFREKYRNADVLMIDDIQFISGKERTTEEIFHTFNELYDANKQMIFTSDRLPKDIPDIDERLRSRFEWGFTADIQPPDLETRIAILRKKAQILKYNVSMEVLTCMAGCIESNVREMEGLLNKVLMLSQLEERPPSVDHVKDAMRDYTAKQTDVISPDDIIDAACRLFNVKKEDVLGKKKTQEFVEPRHLCIFCMTEMLDLPLAAIGNIFGGRDHATVLYSRDKIAKEVREGGKARIGVENIKNMVLKK